MDSESIDNCRDNVDLDGVANKDGMPDDLFGLLNKPVNWILNNFNNIEIKISEVQLKPSSPQIGC